MTGHESSPQDTDDFDLSSELDEEIRDSDVATEGSELEHPFEHRSGAHGLTYRRPPNATWRSKFVAVSMRRVLRPALDRMPPDQRALGRLRTMTNGIGRAGALETSGNWDNTGPVPGLWVGRRRFFTSDKLVFMLHGGGFTFGSPWSHKFLAARFARELGAPTFLPDYRLAPEHQFPAAIEDAIASYEWILGQGYSPENIIFAGDSAGGNLALQLIDHLSDAGEPKPAGVVLLSPWVDMNLADMTSRDMERKDPFLAIGLVEKSRDLYAPGLDPDDPRISPVNLNFSNDWPPFLIQCGGAEIFAGGIELLHERMVASGVDSTLQVWPDQFHVFQAFHPLIPEAVGAIRNVGTFMRAQTD